MGVWKTVFTRVRLLPRLLLLLIFLPLALIFDLVLFAFLGSCPACTSFSQWLASPYALSAPILATLLALIFPRKG